MGIEETRQKIVSVADSLFGRFGFQKTSMDEIARSSRKAKGSLYYHFSSKEDLFLEVVHKELNDIRIRLAEVTDNPDLSPGEMLKQYMRVRMEGLQQATNYHEVIQPDRYDHLEFTDELVRDFESWEKDSLKGMIEEGIRTGDFVLEVEAVVLVEMFLMVARGLEIPFFVQKKFDTYMAHFDELFKMLLKGMRQ